MTLTVTVPKDWIAVSNEIEKRYDNVDKEGKRVITRYNTSWFLNFYEDVNQVAVY